MSIIRNLARASALFLVVLSTAASANTITMTAPASVNVGDSFDVTIFGDFPDGLVAGGGLFNFDPALVSVNSIVLDLAGADPAFSCPGGGNCSSGAGFESIHWGSFSQVIGIGAGVVQMATVSLTALTGTGGGTANFGMVDDPAAGGWFDVAFFGDATPVFNGASTVINPSAIPVPAAVWLFGSGLLGLVGVARRKAA